MDTAHLAIMTALRRLVDAYALAVDGRDAHRFAALFVDDAALEIYEPGQHDAVAVYTGTAELETVVGLVAGYAGTFHVMANHVGEPQSAERATGWTYCLAHHLTIEADKTQDTVMLIRYDDDYVLHDGRWRFQRRRVMRQWNDYIPADRQPLAV